MSKCRPLKTTELAINWNKLTIEKKQTEKKQMEITRVELRASGAQRERPGWIAGGIEK